MSSHETLGLLLVRGGLITRPELYDALRLQRQTGYLLGTCLLSLGYIRPEALLSMLSKQLGIPALPPGTLVRASPEALRRVPHDVALRLRVLPYSWDGSMLGVAIADGRVIEHLQEVAYHARSAVGAYVALETEIDTVLRHVYALEVLEPASVPTNLSERPRPPMIAGSTPPPAQAQALAQTQTQTQTQTQFQPQAQTPEDLGPALLTRAKKPAPPIIRGAPPPAASKEQLERVGFFDAVERIYESKSADEIALWIGRALLNYFARVMLALFDGQRLRVVGSAGLTTRRVDVPATLVPLLASRLGERQIAYGLASVDARSAEIAGVLGFEPGATALIATSWTATALPNGPPRIVAYADNGAATDLYEDLHDIEMLFKETETGLGMLAEKR